MVFNTGCMLTGAYRCAAMPRRLLDFVGLQRAGRTSCKMERTMQNPDANENLADLILDCIERIRHIKWARSSGYRSERRIWLEMDSVVSTCSINPYNDNCVFL
jgi:hypothetical protein